MKRETNFEVMRTISMFFIVIYHCLTHGVGDKYGFPISHPFSFSNVFFSDSMLIMSSISVNLYVMVSGYFLVDREFKLSRLLRTWIYTCFYSCTITIVFVFMQLAPFNMVSIIKSLFPISTDAYWFVTQYIGLLILSPFLAMIVRQLSYRQYIFLLIGGAFLCLSIIPDFPLAKRFHVAHGNSVWSFAYLYIIAGFIKLYLVRVSIIRIYLLTFFVYLLLFACELFLGFQNGKIYLYWLNYNGLPFVLSVLVFTLVKQQKVQERGIWGFFVNLAPYTFGVYLIHDNLYIRKWLWTTIQLSCYGDKAFFPVIVLGTCLGIFVMCTMIDAVRRKAFTIFRVDDMIAKVDKWSF